MSGQRFRGREGGRNNRDLDLDVGATAFAAANP